MIHWAPLSKKFPYLVWHHCHPCDNDMLQNKADVSYPSACKKRYLYAAGKWFPKFTDFRKLVLPSRTLFTTTGIAGVLVLKSPFTHRQLLNFLCPAFFTAPSTRLPTHLLPHSVKRLRLLWSGHCSLSKHCCLRRAEGKLPLTSIIIVTLALCHVSPMVTLCSSGQRTTSDLST